MANFCTGVRLTRDLVGPHVSRVASVGPLFCCPKYPTTIAFAPTIDELSGSVDASANANRLQMTGPNWA